MEKRVFLVSIVSVMEGASTCRRSESSPRTSGLVVGLFPAILRVSRRGSRQHFCSSDLISHACTRFNTSDAEHGPLVRWSSSVPCSGHGCRWALHGPLRFSRQDGKESLVGQRCAFRKSMSLSRLCYFLLLTSSSIPVVSNKHRINR